MLAERLGFEEGRDGMTKLYALRLLERVIVTFLLTAAGTYVADILDLGQGAPQLTALTDLSLGHKALVAGVAAVVQLAISTLVAPHVGDPNSPDLVPSTILKRLGQAEKGIEAAFPGLDLAGAVAAIRDRVEAEHPGLAVDVETLARRAAALYVAERSSPAPPSSVVAGG